MKAMKEAGILVVESPAEMGSKMLEALKINNNSFYAKSEQ